MDIEGAEVAVIESSLDFLSRQPIALAIASYHLDKRGSATYLSLEPAFRSVGYWVQSSDEYGHMMTYALPPVMAGVLESRASSQWSAESAAPIIPAA